MIETMLSLFGGGIMRVIPELVGLWSKKTDNAHELSMLSAQVELEKVKTAGQQTVVREQGQIDQLLHVMESQREAMSDQMKHTGIQFVDALNALVRPLTTYYFLALYGVAKIAMFAIATQNTAGIWEAILKVYTQDDVALFMGIISFWFVGRVFDKK